MTHSPTKTDYEALAKRLERGANKPDGTKRRPSPRELEAATAIRNLTALVREAREALDHITEYWNKDRNDAAIHDALWHIIDTACEVLPKLESI